MYAIRALYSIVQNTYIRELKKLTQYIFRIDDVCPGMDSTKFDKLEYLFDKYEINPIIGVIPDNKDTSLNIDSDDPLFWEKIRKLQVKGWTIAQHGCHHLYVTESPGLLGFPLKSEFSGLEYEVQIEKIIKGKSILQANGIYTNVFMAPSHSFDENTLKALSSSGFYAITDGFGFSIYIQNDIIFVPQQYAFPRAFPFGLVTFCIHPNNLSESKLNRIEKFINKYSKNIISFEDAICCATLKTASMYNKLLHIIHKYVKIKNIENKRKAMIS